MNKKITRIFIVGSDARTVVFAWLLSQAENVEVFIGPGNPGTAKYGINIPYFDITNGQMYLSLCSDKKIDMVVFSPEKPLIAGMVNNLAGTLPNVLCVGPTQEGAQLEGNKAWAKDFMARHRIPTASCQIFTKDRIAEAKEFAKQLVIKNDVCVIKASGPAEGKGVVICGTVVDSHAEIERMFDGKFGEAGATIVIEEFLRGTELSVFALTDGTNYVLLPSAQDYKKRFDGDMGLNTGGMGSFAPISVTDEFMQKVRTRVIEPTLSGMREEENLYKGFLYVGLMNVDGEPYVIEYNCRLGDPETQSVLTAAEMDGNGFLALLQASATGTMHDFSGNVGPAGPYHILLHNGQVKVMKHSATVVLVSENYPSPDLQKGQVITGLEEAAAMPDVILFPAGMKDNGNQQMVVSGGRVVSVTATGVTLDKAREKAYTAAEKIQFEGKAYRTDIAGKPGVTAP